MTGRGGGDVENLLDSSQNMSQEITHSQKLLRRRTSAKGWLTRAKNAALVELGKEPEDGVALKWALFEMDERLRAFDALQLEYESTLEVEDIEHCIEEAALYRDSIVEVRVRIQKELNKLADANSGDSAVPSEDTRVKEKSDMDRCIHRPEVRLPKLIMPKFSGDMLQWQSFWDMYRATVHEGNLPTISKFTYLQSLLEGEAKEVIAGLSLTESNYGSAIALLQTRFGRTETVMFRHIQDIVNLTSGSRPTTHQGLRKLHDSLQVHVRSLQALGIVESQYGVMLTPVILSCLPQDIKIQWARSCSGKENDLPWLLRFLEQEIQFRETSDVFKLSKTPMEEKKPKDGYRSQTPHTYPSAAALQSASSVVDDESCVVCSKTHPLEKCPTFLSMNTDKRWSCVREHRICFRCFSKGHRCSECSLGKCELCSFAHHQLLHSGSRVPVYQGRKTAHSRRKGRPNVVALSTQKESVVIMQTVEVEVHGLKSKTRATILFDNGSDRSYVSSKLISQVGPEFVHSELVSWGAFGQARANPEELRNVFSLEIRGPDGNVGVARVTEIPTVCIPLHRRRVPKVILKSLKSIKLLDDYNRDKSFSVDILIGLDQYWRFVKPEIVPVSESLVIQNTMFGWMLSGMYESAPSDGPLVQVEASPQLFCARGVNDDELRRIWGLELESESKQADTVLSRFNETIRLKEGRYEVQLP